MARYIFGSFPRAHWVLERHSAGIENDITIEEEINVKARHTQRPAPLRSQRLITSTVASENLLRCREQLVGASLHWLGPRRRAAPAGERPTSFAASSGSPVHSSGVQASAMGNRKRSV